MKHNIKDQQRLPWGNIGQKTNRLEEILKPYYLLMLFLKKKKKRTFKPITSNKINNQNPPKNNLTKWFNWWDLWNI